MYHAVNLTNLLLVLAESDMSDIIDPVEYGKLISTVDNLTKKVDSMDTDIKALLQLANQSKGGFWMGMTIASFVGGGITFFMDRVFK